ncbi:aspartate/glutamate racemase family protein [Bizionia paragorgiae]|jgi:aspartate racemase|uniref:Aspartate racemase n=1 Tax=Bizionia paragorgiae TaxID=283786 RepID=A0A1H4C7Z4_BIZPA|nr:aspartate/glutamate racemase family protein [Bizionia paragorgiae]MDX1270486.1 aspartate/glutamate racemase family protein [Bizionia paragorgiae]SEA56459.1 aspartate racemase [Bizionia paragorgiae]
MDQTGSRLGVLGLGNRSTLYYINALNTAFNRQEKGYSTFPLIVYNTNFNTINSYLPNKFDDLIPILSEVLSQIELLPISKLLIPNITLHEAIDRLSLPVQLIHPLVLCRQILKEKQTTSVVVFGTHYTMTSPYISNYFSVEGIQVLSPLEKHRLFIERFRQKVYSKTETEADKISYYQLLKCYSAKSTVILACTELSVMQISNDLPQVIDLADLQIEEALRLHYSQ